MEEPRRPQASAGERRAAAWPWLLGALLAAPTLLVRSPPMTDLPMHAGVVGLMLHWGDDTFVPKGLYAPNFGHPNQLFHLVAYALCKLLGPRLGLGLAAALPQVGIVGGGALFARRARAPWWAALWLAPLALGWAYFWGLAPNLYGLALLLPAVVAIDDLAARPSWRRAAVVAGAYVLLFFAHETAMAAAFAVHLLFVVLSRARARERLRAASPALVALGLAIADVIALTRIHTAAERAFAGDVVYSGPVTRLVDLPETIFGSHPVPVLLALAVLYGGAAFATRRLAEGAPPAPEPPVPAASPPPELRTRLWRARFVLAGLGMLLAYFVVPDQLFGVTMLNLRFAGYAWALLLPSCGAGIGYTVPASRAARLAVLASVAALVALPLVAAPAFAVSHELNVALDRVIEKMAPGQAVMVQRLRPRTAEDLFTAVSCGRVLAERGGRCQVDFTRTSISPLRMTESLVWTGLDRSAASGQTELRPREDLRAYRYLVLCCASDEESRQYEAMLAPYAALVTTDTGWLLFESKLPRIAPNAPERLLFDRARGE